MKSGIRQKDRFCAETPVLRRVSAQAQLATEGRRVRVTAEEVKNPLVRLNKFAMEVDPSVDLTAEQLKGVEQAVEHCPVHNTLLHPPQIALKVASPRQ